MLGLISSPPVHYKNPAKRFSKNHEYWLKKAAQRVAAQNAAAREQLAQMAEHQQQMRASQTYREIRNPSSMSRAKSSGTLTGRPLNPSIVDTSFRHFDAFDRSQHQRFYNQPYDVSALRMLEGEAAGSHTSIPIQAIQRPNPRQRPQTAQPARRTNAHYQAPLQQQRAYEAPEAYTYRDEDAFGQSNSFRPQQSYGAPPSQPLEVYTSQRGSLMPTGEVVEPHTLRAYVPRSQAPFEQTLQQQRLYLGEALPTADPRERSQTFRPQLTAGRSLTPVIPANTLLSQSSGDNGVRR